MSKRILFTFLTLLVIYSGILISYRMFQPDNADVYVYANNIEGALDFETLKDYTLSSGSSSIHYYLFFEQGDNDSIYVINTVFKAVESSIDMNLTNLIEYVDLGDGSSTDVLTELSSTWGVDTYPAFVACHVDGNEIVIDNTLTATSDQPISDSQLKQWLLLNNIYMDESIIATPES